MVKKGQTPWNKGKKGIYSEKTLKKISESGKGRIPWNKGKIGVYSKETIEKMKNIKLGKEPWNKGLKGLQEWHNTSGLIKVKKGNTQGFQKGNIPKTAWKKGNKPWNYVDGRSKLVGPGRYGPNWKKIRKEVLKRDNYQCQMCGKFEGRLEIHHKIPFMISKDNSPDNLITLCATCHRFVENQYFKKIKQKLNIGLTMAEELKQGK